MDAALRYWEDYLTAAEAMGYQLHRENVLLPKALGAAHDSATVLMFTPLLIHSAHSSKETRPFSRLYSSRIRMSRFG